MQYIIMKDTHKYLCDENDIIIPIQLNIRWQSQNSWFICFCTTIFKSSNRFLQIFRGAEDEWTWWNQCLYTQIVMMIIPDLQIIKSINHFLSSMQQQIQDNWYKTNHNQRFKMLITYFIAKCRPSWLPDVWILVLGVNYTEK